MATIESVRIETYSRIIPTPHPMVMSLSHYERARVRRGWRGATWFKILGWRP